jgi:type I restriction enzyme S subunit
MSNRLETKAMKPESKRVLKPNLRFPEFRDAPQWTEKPLEQILSPIVRERKKPVEAYTGLGMRSHGKGTFLKNLENPEKNSMEYLYEVQCDDLIVNITFAWEGAIAIAKPTDTGALVSHRFPTYVFKRDSAIPDFVRYIILDKQFIYKLGVISPGGAGRNRVLNKNDFLKLRVFLPKVSEQQKVADCLTNLDALIAAHGQELDALKAHKKGLLEQLSPRIGETVPRLRFPEFRDAEGWDADGLSNVADFVNERIPLEKLGVVNYVSTENILADFSGVTTASKLPTTGSATRFKVNDILVSNIRPYLKKVWFSDKDGGASNDVIVIRAKHNLSPQYLPFILKNDSFIAYAMRGAKGVKMPRGDVSLIREYPVAYPSIPEQQKLAECLTSLDELISAQAQKLNALKTHKIGLMQQLFPSPEEVEA